MNILSPVGFYMRKAASADGKKERERALSLVEDRLSALGKLTRELREYYRAPTLAVRPVSLESVVESCLNDLSVEYGDQWRAPHCQGLGVELLADAQKLKQVFFIIDNQDFGVHGQQC